MSNVTNIRLRVLPRFPARILGANGFTVVRDGTDLVVQPDYGQLAVVPAVPDMNESFFQTWTRNLDTYSIIPFQSLVDNIGDVIIGPNLSSIGALETVTDTATYWTGEGEAGLYTITDFVRTISASADAGEYRDGLGLGTAALEDANAFASAAEGTLASSALQPDDIGVSVASAAEGDLATTAVQPAALAAVAPALSADTILVDNAAGTARENKSFPEVRDLLGIDRPKRAKKIKLLLTADWQPQVDGAGQVDALRSVLEDMETYHSDSDFALNLGDLVDRPTVNDTGVPYGYSYTEMYSDMRDRVPSIPLSRWLFLPGNHDRDGTGLGAWQSAWTYRSYRNEVGPLFYCVDYGNLRIIFMGDMAGSVNGEILDFAIDWFRLVMSRSRQMNIIVCFHQPADADVYPPSADAPEGGAYQRNPTRFTDIIAANDNVVCCFYGHVGGNLNDSTLITEAHGTKWLNLQMGINTALTVGFDLHYAVTEIEEGDIEIAIRRWNATTHDWLGLNDATITLKYPAQLSGDHLDFDGRKQVDPLTPFVYGPQVAYQSIADYRGSGPFGVPGDIYPGQKLILADDAGDNLTTQGIGTYLYIPGAINDVSPAGDYASPAYGLGAIAGARRASSDDESYLAAYEIWVKNAAQSMVLGLRMEDDAFRLQSGTFDAASGDTSVGFQIVKSTGQVNAGSSTTLMRLKRSTAGTGNLMAFYHLGTLSGTISLNGAATTYATSSDKGLKDDLGEMTFAQARAILDLITIHRFRWNERAGSSEGVADEGVFAQELFDVYPKAVIVGGWYDEETGDEGGEGDEGVTYRPWGVDYSKLISIVARCVQGVMARSDAIETRVAELEAVRDG